MFIPRMLSVANADVVSFGSSRRPVSTAGSQRGWNVGAGNGQGTLDRARALICGVGEGGTGFFLQCVVVLVGTGARGMGV